MTGRIQSSIKKSEAQPEKVGESSRGTQKRLDAELDKSSTRAHPLPYSDSPPLGSPDVWMSAPEQTSADSTLPDESTTHHDITNDLCQRW